MSHCRAKAEDDAKNLYFMLNEDIQELARKEKEGKRRRAVCLSYVFQKTRNTSYNHKNRNWLRG